MNNQLNRIQKQIEHIKQELQKIGEMRPGSLTRQMVSQNNQKYSYYQLSYTYNMQSRTDYVKKIFLEDLKCHRKKEYSPGRKYVDFAQTRAW